MRMFLAGLMLALAVVLSGCTSDQERAAIESQRRVADSLNAWADNAADLKGSIESGAVRWEPLIAELKELLPADKLDFVRAAERSGLQGWELVEYIRVGATTVASNLDDAADAAEQRIAENDNNVARALSIAEMVLYGLFGGGILVGGARAAQVIPTPKQKRETDRAIQLSEATVRAVEKASEATEKLERKVSEFDEKIAKAEKAHKDSVEIIQDIQAALASPAPIPPMTPEEVRARHGVGGGA